MDNFTSARSEELRYHEQFYKEHDLFENDTWLSEPEELVMDALDQLEGDNIRVLDLGCGVGRNSIPIARKLKPVGGRVDCVDLLPTAIDMLMKNAEKFDVAECIKPIVADAEGYQAPENTFDLIAACGCLEHVSSEEALQQAVQGLQAGTRPGGIHCLLINTDVTEQNRTTGKRKKGRIELNASLEQAVKWLNQWYQDWEIITQHAETEEIEESKGGKKVIFKSQLLSFMARKPDRSYG